jgi:hypothetical protein
MGHDDGTSRAFEIGALLALATAGPTGTAPWLPCVSAGRRRGTPRPTRRLTGPRTNAALIPDAIPPAPTGATG